MEEIKYSNQNNGETFIKIKIGNQIYTIRGFSRGGLRTCILIDEFNVVFDMGYSNDRAFSYDNKLISHGHTDHIGALHTDHCARKLFNIHKERLYIMPFQCIQPFKLIASAVSEMNCGKSSEQIKIFDKLLMTEIISSEDCIDNYNYLIGKQKYSEYVVKSFLMDHRIKSFGYIIYRKSKKLKPEFTNLNIVEIKKEFKLNNPDKNVDEYLTTIHYTPLVGYSGDTTINGIINNPEFLNVPLLIMECTGFLDNDIEEINNGKHIHFNDIIKYKNEFKNDKILLFHFSQQYHNLEDILNITKETEELKDKLLYFF
jgi:ribonuclease Z